MTDEELQSLVEKISLQFFQKPFRHLAVFNSRLKTTGGRYLLQTHNIEINKRYYEQLGEQELIGIIKHELCHYHLHLEKKGYMHQDKDFKNLMLQVGAPRFCGQLPDRPETNRSLKVYVYSCSRCSLVFKRKRAVNIQKYVCGKCKGKLKKVTVLTNK
ncbi:SprT family protein [Bacillus sp. CGMCC 1.16607]|uniref:SprT family protein n=1 Tax=Bacillus sp. CGMCC 1.16607 TaxID=3351842 RepID=UPI00362B8163